MGAGAGALTAGAGAGTGAGAATAGASVVGSTLVGAAACEACGVRKMGLEQRQVATQLTKALTMHCAYCSPEPAAWCALGQCLLRLPGGGLPGTSW